MLKRAFQQSSHSLTQFNFNKPYLTNIYQYRAFSEAKDKNQTVYEAPPVIPEISDQQIEDHQKKIIPTIWNVISKKI